MKSWFTAKQNEILCCQEAVIKTYDEAKAVKKVILSVMILAFVASSMTLWLLELPLKPILYFFEAVLILIIYHSLSGTFKRIQGLKVNEGYYELAHTCQIIN